MRIINNMPEYAYEYEYIVAREDETDGGLWFWGAYEDEKTARKAAREIDGVVIKKVDK